MAGTLASFECCGFKRGRLTRRVDVVRTAGALDEVRRRMMTHVGVAVTSERMLCEALRVLTGPRH